jgi:putative peptidoglycan lipid II flippase
MRSPVTAVYIIIGLTALTGFVREAAIAASFGFGQETDAFFFAIGLIQTAHDLIFNGSLSASVIPLLRPLAIATGNDTLQARAKFVTTLTVIILASGLVLAGLLYFGIPAIVSLLSPEMTGTTRAETIAFGRILVWLLPANAMLTLFSLILNAHDRFRAATSIYLGANLVFIAIILFLGPLIGPDALPIAGLAGPLIFGPWLAIRLWRFGLLKWVKLDFTRSFFASVLKLSGPPLLSLGIGSSVGLLMASHMILRGFAAAFGQGGISATGYAFRLYEAPISIIINPVATLIFPVIAAFVATGRLEKFATTCRQVLTWGLIVMLPVAVATYAGAEIVVTILLKRGSFDETAMKLTAEALRGFAPAVLFEGVFVVFFRVFYALRKPGVPVAVALITLAALTGLLHLTGDSSLLGLAMTLSLAFALAAVLLLITLRKIAGPGSLPDGGETLRLLVVALVAGLPALAFDHYLGRGLIERCLSLTVYFIGYSLGLAILLPHRRDEAVEAFLRRFRRTPVKGQL